MSLWKKAGHTFSDICRKKDKWRPKISEDGEKVKEDKENKWNYQSSAQWRRWHYSCKVNSQWEIQVSKSIAIPLPPPPPALFPAKVSWKKENLAPVRSGLSAKDLEVDTLKRQEPCFTHVPHTPPMRGSAQRTCAQSRNGMWQGVNKRLIKWLQAARSVQLK